MSKNINGKQEKPFPELDERRVSFNDRNNTYYSRSAAFYSNLLKASQREDWGIVSPMTRHVISSERSEDSFKLPRSRSRSFNDYIESRDNDTEYGGGARAFTSTTQAPLWAIRSSRGKMISSRIKEEGPGDNDIDGGGKEGGVQTAESEMPFSLSVLYGAINCTIVLPVIMSFGNIIYRDNAFIAYMPVLIKLTLFSGMIHQLCFSIFSTLDFAVGSVQDAGLIFLSRMAYDMVQYCRAKDYDDETMLATVTIGLGCATAALGLGLIIIGKLGLATYVQMLPTCVIAGYLAYIGWFVGYSGLGIMAGQSALTPTLLIEKSPYILPGVAGGAFIYISVRKFRHVAVLPLCITLLLVVFYVILLVTGTSIEEATDNGWIRKTEEEPAWYQTWDYLRIEKVDWGALPQLWLTWVGMLFVVALSSSLDVAAIELEMNEPLNYNKELGVVGISNFISGITGGYTGSYIFSQTIFSLRIGVRSRISGFSIAFFTLVVIVLPFPILSYVPNFFYGSLLSMICIDLVYEWLWEFRHKVTTAEYLIGLSTFGMIQFFGVEYGIVMGVALYVFCRQLNIDVGELKTIYTEGEGNSNSTEAKETTTLVANGKEAESYTSF
uniref:SLC26A/SulP transporter domain-containing protein n=1 Tax=Pseudo-nitzschia australis TaxID=44445 RepID=A0A7S4EEM5_9STRA|mmetsp:Transcript_4151/g.7543  ORF Transcript_4151/g.7543 Transcript_4151/m.7543 type:complete len:609 (+) Transcript_4151:140-1966(+)|eukprot:CAMPEP_0168225128 /NCGR_PEP_ID=MMETSP0140_2-20121125/12512_1 /TAXON_ID=44445 /ORGANISM="Pseudo-nitzschia australis, Strain 10249 10 AB" /LENGTH=608 /DNA_ID=CAMNT_0008155723 /DNA_START=53 /DNA_END=1879 /DNA_ORIENTATION=-